MRPTPNGKGSYDLILDKFKRMAELRGQTRYYVRGTFTRENLDFAKDVLHLADEGFQQISIEPVVAGDKETYALREGICRNSRSNMSCWPGRCWRERREAMGSPFSAL